MYLNKVIQQIQKPHPPIWYAGGGSVETWKFAAEHDYTYSYLSFFGHKAAKTLLDRYWDVVANAGRDMTWKEQVEKQGIVIGEVVTR